MVLTYKTMMAITNKIVHYKETVEYRQYLIFWPRSQRRVHCHTAKPEPNQRVSMDRVPCKCDRVFITTKEFIVNSRMDVKERIVQGSNSYRDGRKEAEMMDSLRSTRTGNGEPNKWENLLKKTTNKTQARERNTTLELT
jgi:hypothetical protein